jgi:leucyl aminopeptidase (aminopeptidase T)
VDQPSQQQQQTSEQQQSARPISPVIREIERNGVKWVVQEFPAPNYDRRGDPSLMFASDEVMRRVRTYPDNWAELSDEELYALSMRF